MPGLDRPRRWVVVLATVTEWLVPKPLKRIKLQFSGVEDIILLVSLNGRADRRAASR